MTSYMPEPFIWGLSISRAPLQASASSSWARSGNPSRTRNSSSFQGPCRIFRLKGVSRSYFTRIVRLSYLAPDITQAILDGRQPCDLTADKLLAHSRLPLAWHKQRTLLGFAWPDPGSTPNRHGHVPRQPTYLLASPATVPKPRRQHGGTGIGPDRDIAVLWCDIARSCASLATAPPNRAAHTRAKAAVLDLQRPGLCETRTCMGVFLSSGFLLLPVPCLERKGRSSSPAIRFAERAERCQGTEMLAQLSGLPLSVACVFAAPLFKPGAGFDT